VHRWPINISIKHLFQFVAHPSCQKKLASMWMGHLNPSWVSSPVRSLFFLMCLCLFYPFAAILYWVYPYKKVCFAILTSKRIFLKKSAIFIDGCQIFVQRLFWGWSRGVRELFCKLFRPHQRSVVLDKCFKVVVKLMLCKPIRDI
jgi:hypothetical protein